MTADLASRADVRSLAERFAARHGRLDLLVNNAAGLYGERVETADGVEATLALTHLSPALLTHLLLPLLRESAPARIVNVSAGAHRWARVRWDDLQSERGYRGMDVYARAKLLNLMWTGELARRVRGTGITVVSADPGSGVDGDDGGDDARDGAGAAARALSPRAADAARAHGGGGRPQQHRGRDVARRAERRVPGFAGPPGAGVASGARRRAGPAGVGRDGGDAGDRRRAARRRPRAQAAGGGGTRTRHPAWCPPARRPGTTEGGSARRSSAGGAVCGMGCMGWIAVRGGMCDGSGCGRLSTGSPLPRPRFRSFLSTAAGPSPNFGGEVSTGEAGAVA